MTDKTTIEINVDTFSDADGFFVRTEIEARSVNVNISGPFPNLEGAQGLKARQLANRERWRRHSRSNCGAPLHLARRRSGLLIRRRFQRSDR